MCIPKWSEVAKGGIMLQLFTLEGDDTIARSRLDKTCD